MKWKKVSHLENLQIRWLQWISIRHLSRHSIDLKGTIIHMHSSVVIFFPFHSKTAITLAKKTVGRFIGRSSADKMPDFSSFFIGQQKINYNYLVIIFFPSADSFGVLAIGRWSADDRPISRPMSYVNEPHIIGRCVGRPSADHRPIVAHHLSSADVSADDRPIVKFWV